MIKYLFWDFDGTLYDSYPQILESLKLGLGDLGMDLLPDDTVLMLNLKKSLRVVYDYINSLNGLEQDRISKAYHLRHDSLERFPLYMGVADMLETLHNSGVKHFLYTHRNSKALTALHLDNIDRFFSDAVTADDHFPGKPAPDALIYLLNKHHIPAGESAMIGDRDIDLLAGINAGMKGILFDPDGYYSDFDCSARFNSFAELTIDFLNRI